MLEVVAVVAWLGTGAVGPRTEVPAGAAGTPAGGSPEVVRPVRIGDRGVFRLDDGATVYGQLRATGPEGDLVELTSGAVLRFAPGRIVGLETADDEPPGAGDERPARIYLHDGTVVRGRVLDEGPPLRLELPDGIVRTIEAGELRQVARGASPGASEAGWGDPARQRYGAAPSALMLPWRSWQVALLSGTEPAVSYGLTPWLTAAVSAPLPVAEASGFGPALVATATAGRPFGDLLHVAGGLRLRASGGVSAAAALGAFVTATVGTADASASLHLGPPPLRPFRGDPLGEPAGALAGAVRMGGPFRLLAEVWVADATDAGRGVATRASLAVRTTWHGLAADVGLTSGSSAQVAAWFAVSHTWEARP